jgi:hypothetical protein
LFVVSGGGDGLNGGGAGLKGAVGWSAEVSGGSKYSNGLSLNKVAFWGNYYLLFKLAFREEKL